MFFFVTTGCHKSRKHWGIFINELVLRIRRGEPFSFGKHVDFFGSGVVGRMFADRLGRCD